MIQIYNLLLLFACDILIRTAIDLRVWHIPGAMNTVADSISRQLLSLVYTTVPGIRIAPFIPPQFSLGDPEK